MVSASYAFGTAAAVPVFNPPAGEFAAAQNIAISATTPGASIVYTTDGSTPSPSNGTLYSAPVSVTGSTMLKAIAYTNSSYGISPVAGALYSITAAPSPIVNVLHDFSPADNGGFYPMARLMQAVDGNFYGTTQLGGAFGEGTVYKINSSRTFGTLTAFNGANGASPQGALVQDSSGNFLGTTYAGGASDQGTVFKVAPNGTLTSLYSFSGSDGANPQGGLTLSADGNFYGTTSNGGVNQYTSSGAGTVFKLTPEGGLTNVVFLESGSLIGSNPSGALTKGNDGNFYGVAEGGYGTIFKVTPAGAFTHLYEFYSAPTGRYARGDLAKGYDGNFYGVTMLSGTGGQGTVFKITSSGVLNTLGSFNGTDGAAPLAGMVLGNNGNFYGTTTGMSYNDGTLYKLSRSGVLSSLFSFNGFNGSSPWAGLLQGADGYFYGTTRYGGLYDLGVVYQLIIPSSSSPVFDPPPGVYYTGTQSISITSTTPGATIRYTLDGSMPSATTGLIYSGPVSLASSATVKAIASAPGLDDSPITSGSYDLTPAVSAPVFSPAPGTYSNYQVVTMTSTTSDALIRYTTDGSTPSASVGTLYTGPVVVTGTTTLLAVAYKAGYTDSPVVSGSFTINFPPTISPTTSTYGTTFGSSEHVKLSFNASDSDGAVAKIEIYRNGSLVSPLAAFVTGTTWTFTDAANLSPGTYNYTAVASDALGATTTSSIITITVLPSLPYIADFETAEGYTAGSLDGQMMWKLDAGAARVDSGDAAHGSQFVALTSGEVAAQVEQRLWIAGDNFFYLDFYAKPLAATDATAGSLYDFEVGRLGFVQNGETAQLAALDGDGAGGGTWKQLTAAVATDAAHVASAWQRLSVRIDRLTSTYDVYLNGQMVVADLKFCTYNVSNILKFTNGGQATTATALDNLYCGVNSPLFADTNNNGIDDAWETAHGLSLTSDNRSVDSDGDGVSDLQEYINGTDPQDFYNGIAPVLTIVSGNNQSVAASQYGNPFVVAITNASGLPIANAPVTFEVVAGGGLLVGLGGPSTTVTRRTDLEGMVYQVYQQPATAGVNSQIRVSASSANVSFASTSMAANYSPDDTDANGLPDEWEQKYYGHTGVDPNAVTASGLTNAQALAAGTNPLMTDTDGDGRSDKDEITQETNPTIPDALNEIGPFIAVPLPQQIENYASLNNRGEIFAEAGDSSYIFSNAKWHSYEKLKMTNSALWILQPKPLNNNGEAVLFDARSRCYMKINGKSTRVVFPATLFGNLDNGIFGLVVYCQISDDGKYFGCGGASDSYFRGDPAKTDNWFISPNTVENSQSVTTFNNSGEMVGTESMPNFLTPHRMFLIDKEHKFTFSNIADDPNSLKIFVRVNDKKVAIGYSDRGYFQWDVRSNQVELFDIYTWLYDINNRGDVLGEDLAESFVYIGGVFRDIRPLITNQTDIGSSFYAWQINDARQILASWKTPEGSSTFGLLTPIPHLWVDNNRNGVININQDDLATTDKPFCFQLNDDDDDDDKKADANDSVVNGATDLKDFFPVYLDLKQLLSVMPPATQDVKYILKQEDKAVNFVYTNLTRATAFSYKGGLLTAGFGPNFDQPASSATTQQITDAGIELSAEFLDRIITQDQGVILVEGRSSSAKPLVLSIVKGGSGISSIQLPLLHFDVHYDADCTTPEGYPNIETGDLGLAERTAQRSNDIEKYPGVMACVNYYPITKNGVVGYAAGIDKFGNGQPNICGLFKPFLIEVASLEKYHNAKFVFDYAGSDPDQMTIASVTGETEYVLPADGNLRIWKKDGGDIRKPQGAESGGDYVSPSHGYTADELGWNGTDRYITLYIEVVDANYVWNLAPFNIMPVNVKMFPDGNVGDKNGFSETIDIVPFLLSYANTDF